MKVLLPSPFDVTLTLCLMVSFKQGWVLMCCQKWAAAEPKALLTVALGWTRWFVISNPLRLLWCRQLCVFLCRMLENLVVFPMGYWRLSCSWTCDTLTSASLAALMLARIPGEEACADSVGLWLCSVSPCARQVSTEWAKEPLSLLLSLSLLNSGAGSLQCIWISWKAKVGRLPKINRNILFLLPLLYPQRLFRCYLKQRSSWAHCLLPAFASCRLTLLQFPSAGGSLQFPPLNMVCVNVKEWQTEIIANGSCIWQGIVPKDVRPRMHNYSRNGYQWSGAECPEMSWSYSSQDATLGWCSNGLGDTAPYLAFVLTLVCVTQFPRTNSSSKFVAKEIL